MTQGLVSRTVAEEIYGVALNDRLEVDRDRTDRRRARLLKRRRNGFIEDQEDPADEKVFSPEADRVQESFDESELSGGFNLSENLRAVQAPEGVSIQCTKCGHGLVTNDGRVGGEKCIGKRAPFSFPLP